VKSSTDERFDFSGPILQVSSSQLQSPLEYQHSVPGKLYDYYGPPGLT
jgi:hypothetical protein